MLPAMNIAGSTALLCKNGKNNGFQAKKIVTPGSFLTKFFHLACT